MSAPTHTSPASASGGTHVAVTVAATATLVLGMLVAVLAGTVQRGAATGFGDGIDVSWAPAEQVLADGATADAARLEALPDGRLAAVLVADGSSYGNPGVDVLVTRVRSAVGTWSDAEVVPTAGSTMHHSTFDTYADTAGRILAVWADTEGTDDGQWSIQWASRGIDGTWSTPAELYAARTNNFNNLALEATYVTPRLVPSGDVVTLAWTDAAGYSTARIDVEDDPFHARRWTGGAWGPVLSTDGYSVAASGIDPTSPENVQIWADPSRSARVSDGRISIVYTLRKSRPIHSTGVPPGDGYTGVNVANVWDGVPETRWQATSETTWVMHLDPDDAGWGVPQQLVRSDNSGTVCNPPQLPADPPLEANWSVWKAASLDPGITTSCTGTESRATGAAYASDGTLRVSLRYRSGPGADVTINQYLDIPCDDPSGSDTYRFCFDDWGPTDWVVDWPAARIGIPMGDDGVGVDAAQEGTWTPLPTSTTVSTDAGPVTVTDQSGPDGASILIDSGDTVEWVPNPDGGTVYVTHVFAHGDDVAIFYRSGTEDGHPECAMGVLRGGEDTVTGPLSGCATGTTPAERDVVQLTDGRLAHIDVTGIGTPVRILGADGAGPTGATTGPTGPTAPNPLPPPPSTFTNTETPTITGKARVGRKLKAKPGSWSPAPATIGYQWFANNKSIKKATAKKLRLKAGHRGKKISVRITVTRAGVATVVRVVKAKGRVK